MDLQPSLYGPVLISLVLSALFVPITWNLIWPRWKRYGKLLFSVVVSVLLAAMVGWWSLIFILGHPLMGLVGHLWWCRSHGFDWKSVDPEQYRASQEAWVARMNARQRQAK